MESPNPQNNTIPNSPLQQQTELPGATSVLVLGILSLVFIGLIGLILGIIAIAKAKECKANYLLNPNAYTLGSYKNMNGGRICAIVSISILCGLLFIILIAILVANMF